MYLSVAVTGYSISFFTPTILKELGWTALRTQVMTVPVYMCAGCVTIIVAVFSDLLRHRYAFTILGLTIAVIGYAILLHSKAVTPGTRYLAIYFVSTGGFITQPITVAWLNNNMGGHYKRAIAAAVQIGLGNCGGLIASNIYITAQAPTYHTGYSTGLGFICLGIVACTSLLLYCVFENRNRDKGGRDGLFQLPPEELNNLGDDYPTFRYTY
jgi:MFS family permease